MDHQYSGNHETAGPAPEARIAPEGDYRFISNEVKNLPATACLVHQGGFAVYVAKASQIPVTLQEIGRLREIAFRRVGEGTGKERDLDQYDQYYWHLFIWDESTRRIAGGYRIGEGDEIFNNKGLEGFYIFSLFHIAPEFSGTLVQSVELGRSFVLPGYQKKRLPLFLLWKGILRFLVDRPQFRFLIGPVSISKFYSDLSKSLIVAFVKHFFYDHESAQYIRPRTPFSVPLKDIDLQSALRNIGDINSLENVLEHIEPDHLKLPILLKQYIRQNAKFIGFNLDPNFNDALDGLMLLDLREARKETIENLTQNSE